MRQKTQCPTDAQALRAWTEIMHIAEAHALICQACGGTATLALPEEQRRAGIRNRVLRASMMIEESAEVEA